MLSTVLVAMVANDEAKGFRRVSQLFPAISERRWRLGGSHGDEEEVELYEDLKVIGKEQVHTRGQLALCALEYGKHSFKLPPSSPYEKFLKTAGC
ncbi:hypothetical protein V6N12_025602 [Hibiscus sabdariffa]|uniref:Uncharacterized protein n=1 Tax=Hibiscus sabdariffa TaxID=183260 RepID=A0ABR2CL62_9ROSI